LTAGKAGDFLLNLSPLPEDDAQRERLAEQIVANLQSPDIVALQEIQDNNGTTSGADSEVTDATETLQALVDAIAAAGGPTYAFADIAPVDDTSGGIPGGNIRNSFLYNPERVALAELTSVDQNPAFAGTRNPLVGEFLFNGETVTVINNHLTSRFGSSPVFGALQPFIQAGEADREAQAQALNNIVDDIVAENSEAKVIVLGDLNTFEFTDDLSAILPGTGEQRVLTNLVNQAVAEDDAYTFIFDGNSQVLDHMFVTDSLLDEAMFDIVHVNNDFPRDDGRVRFADTIVASDHEPLVGKFVIEPRGQEILGSAIADSLTGNAGDDLLRGGLGNDTLRGDDQEGSGSDTFVLAAGEGTDKIMDFEVGTDLIGLADGLSFGALTLSGNSIGFGDETLATFENGVMAADLSEASFVTV
ncbi:MAG: multifunctional hydrolase/phosphatase/nucleotidase, partial [Leptolyngbya sp. SIO4C1]|nr:multifunctional hydrolase/phosphatase/nucleotidase [Leptolyngbya sp. SIO4C1]